MLVCGTTTRSKAESSNPSDSAPATFSGRKRQLRLMGRMVLPCTVFSSASAGEPVRAAEASTTPAVLIKSRLINDYPFRVSASSESAQAVFRLQYYRGMGAQVSPRTRMFSAGATAVGGAARGSFNGRTQQPAVSAMHRAGLAFGALSIHNWKRSCWQSGPGSFGLLRGAGIGAKPRINCMVRL